MSNKRFGGVGEVSGPVESGTRRTASQRTWGRPSDAPPDAKGVAEIVAPDRAVGRPRGCGEQGIKLGAAIRPAPAETPSPCGSYATPSKTRPLSGFQNRTRPSAMGTLIFCMSAAGVANATVSQLAQGRWVLMGSIITLSLAGPRG